MAVKYIAHSAATPGGKPQSLRDHSWEVADRAEKNCPLAPYKSLVWLAALGHDIGKAWLVWLTYALSGFKGKSPGHVGQGTLYFFENNLPLVASLISWHHSGIRDVQDQREYQKKIEEKSKGDPDYTAASFKVLDGWVAELNASNRFAEAQKAMQDFAQLSLYDKLMVCRILLSSLVDGDWTDTEVFYDPSLKALRDSDALFMSVRRHVLAQADAFDALPSEDPAKATGVPSPEQVNGYRKETLRVVRERSRGACQGPGIYLLDCPTGAGKTFLAAVAAAENGSSRLIFAAPYNTIVDQTAQNFRGWVGKDNVIEHTTAEQISSKADGKMHAAACGNWQSPVVVTSHVQVFETLYAAGCGQLRKLHRIAGCTLMVDEFHSIPVGVLEPAMRALEFCAKHLGCRVILSSATPISLALLKQYLSVDATLLDPSTSSRRAALERRVDYRFRLNRWKWSDLEREVSTHRQVMVTVNTRRHVEALRQELGAGPGFYYLTSYMYPAHRLRVLDEVRERLDQDLPCTLIATPLCECGVNISFPIGYRCLTKLDSIIQAAGRLGRHGGVKGILYVFDTEDDYWFPGIRAAGQHTLPALKSVGFDMHDPALFDNYNRRVFSLLALDSRRVLASDVKGARDISRRMKLIDDRRVSVVVPETDDVLQAWKELDAGGIGYGRRKALYAKVRPYIVGLYPHEADKARAAGWAFGEGPVLLWTGVYDLTRGVNLTGF